MKKIIFLSLLLNFNAAVAQVITTYAGNAYGAGTGTGGYSGDGGPATAAELFHPVSIALDASGNLYIVDQGNNAVRMVDAYGIMSTYAGSLNTPTSVAVDGSGTVYIADFYPSWVLRSDTAWPYLPVFAGSLTEGFSGDGGPASAAELHAPFGVAVDASQNLYIADEENGRVRKVTKAGIISTIAGDGTDTCSGDNGPAANAKMYNPYSVATGINKDIYIGDISCNTVRKIDSNGIISLFAGNDTEHYSGNGGPAIHAEIFFPYGLCTDPAENVYIADSYNNVVRKVSVNGIITTVAGNGYRAGMFVGGYAGDGGPATAAELSTPYSVAVDRSGNLYIADYNNNVIRKVSNPSAAVNTIAKPSTSELKLFPDPTHGSFTLTLSSANNEDAQITITNMLGGKIKEFTVATNKQTALQLDAPPGVYFISGITDNGRVSAKLVVE